MHEYLSTVPVVHALHAPTHRSHTHVYTHTSLIESSTADNSLAKLGAPRSTACTGLLLRAAAVLCAECRLAATGCVVMSGVESCEARMA